MGKESKVCLHCHNEASLVQALWDGRLSLRMTAFCFYADTDTKHDPRLEVLSIQIILPPSPMQYMVKAI